MNENENENEVVPLVPFVITCGDEGVQINQGIRISFIGSGVKLEGFDKAVAALKKLLGEDRAISIASCQENDWTKDQFELDTFEQANATAQQQVQAIAEEVDLPYAGYLPFTDPRQLKHGIKGHMVRPENVHIASKVCFTLGGGEQIYNLGHYQISAEWINSVPKKLAEKMLKTQVDFYQKVAGDVKLTFVVDEDGELGEKVIAKNRKLIEKFGYSLPEPVEKEE